MKGHMRYQRMAKTIPVVPSAEEVVRILEAAPGPGLKCRAAFSVAYGGGLRGCEVTHLKVGDLDSDRMLIRIDQGKGLKDRPTGWLFPGRNRVDPISTRQFNRAFGVACDFAEIKKTRFQHDVSKTRFQHDVSKTRFQHDVSKTRFQHDAAQLCYPSA